MLCIDYVLPCKIYWNKVIKQNSINLFINLYNMQNVHILEQNITSCSTLLQYVCYVVLHSIYIVPVSCTAVQRRLYDRYWHRELLLSATPDLDLMMNDDMGWAHTYSHTQKQAETRNWDPMSFLFLISPRVLFKCTFP